MRRICVWNTAFLGDAVLTLPLLQAVKTAWPEAALDFWVRPGLEHLFAGHPLLHAVLPAAKRGANRGPAGLLRLSRALREGRYDLMLCAHTSPRSALAALGSGIPLRVGYKGGPLSRLAFHQTVDRAFTRLAEIERLLRLLEPLGLPPADPWPRLVLPEGARQRMAALWHEHALDNTPVLGLHPGSVWPTKRWPAGRFGSVAALALRAGLRVLVLAGPGEESLAQELVETARREAPEAFPGLLDLSGRLSLPELAACIARLDCYLCNDSGPLHLAWPQGVPVVALFGPTVRELGFFPRGEHSTVLERPLPCRPCGKHGGLRCPEGHHACMLELEPEAVWAAVQQRLERRPTREVQP